MKKLFNIAVLLMLCTAAGAQSSSAGTITFCENYDANGNPIGAGTTWLISQTGSNVYMVYQHGKRISDDELYILIDRMVNGTYEEYENTKMSTYNKSWAMLDYKFTEAGEYQFRIYDKKYANLATGYTTIKYKDGGGTTNTNIGGNSSISAPPPPDAGGTTNNYNSGGNTNNNSGGNTNYNSGGSTTTTKPVVPNQYYYSNSKISFCEDVVNGNCSGAYTSFDISKKTGSWLMIYIDNAGKPILSEGLILDVYKKDGKDYEFYKTDKYDITSTWDHPNIKYTFTEKGDYKVNVYNKESVKINTGYVTINYK